jgi:hypothetical protein
LGACHKSIRQKVFEENCVKVKSQKLSSRLKSFAIILGILAVPTLLCGFTVSFKAAFQTWVFLLTALIPMVGGTLIIYKYFWENQKLSSSCPFANLRIFLSQQKQSQVRHNLRDKQKLL